MRLERIGQRQASRPPQARLLVMATILLGVWQANVCAADGLTPAQLQALLAAGNASSSASTDTIARQIAASAGNVAAAAVQSNGGDASFTMLTATGTTTARTQAARAADMINVMDFGARGDDVTDDSGAINTALAFARTFASGKNGPYVGTAGPYARVLFPSGHRFRIVASGINLTGLPSNGIDIDMEGASIDCHVAGGICVDALGSNELRFHSVRIVGDPTDMPKIGLQIGRTDINLTADNHHFDQLQIVGQFQFAGLYDLAAETSTFIHPEIWNFSGIAGSYAAVFDGFNHAFTYYPNGLSGTPVTSTVASAFASTANIPPESNSSFNETTIYGGDIRSNIGYGIPIWMGRTARFAMDKQSYVAGGGTGCGSYCYGVVMWMENGTSNTMPSFDAHFEDPNLTDIFYFAGDNTGITYGLRYAEQSPQASNSLFKAAPNVTSIGLRDVDLQIGSYYASTTRLFDNPAIWGVSGRYSSQSFTGFNAVNWSGRITIAGSDYPLATYGANAISAQVPDSTTTGGNTRGNYATDFQRSRNAASQVASGLGSLAGGAGNTASGSYSTAVGANNAATGAGSFAGGQTTTAAGTGAFSYGVGSRSSGTASTVIGTQGDDHGNNASLIVSGGQFVVSGDAQVGHHILSGSGTGSSAFRLTVGGSIPASAATCLGLPQAFSAALTIHLHATDNTTRGTDYDWYLPQAMLTRDGAVSTTAYAAGPTSASIVSRGTTTGSTVSVSADTTNGCLNLTFTPPSGNTNDIWHAVAAIETVELQ